MMIIINSKRNVFFVGLLVGVAIFLGINAFVVSDSDQSQKIQALEHKVLSLELLLDKKEEDLKAVRLSSLRARGNNNPLGANQATESLGVNNGPQSEPNDLQTLADSTPNSIQLLKDLGTHSVNDPRSFSEKANALLSDGSSKEKVAVVSKGIFDMANDRENLPDYALQSLYANQADADVKRVIAQVLSQRGNNALMDNHIAETQARLKSENSVERQQALQNLAKTHYANAANVVAPLLNDADINVRLDALLALRATGNQSHLRLVEKLINDPDPAVSSLANDVASNLKNLSDSARTTLSSSDIAAELPLMEHP